MYRLFLVTTDVEALLLEMYCAGKPFWWKWFFGWRKTKHLGVNGTGSYYKVPYKIFLQCENFARELANEFDCPNFIL